MAKRHILLIDLVDEPAALASYEAWHAARAVPDVVVESIVSAGIFAMDIYRTGNRLVMVMDTDDSFDAVAKSAADAADPDICAWESLMDTVQRPLPWAEAGAKWTTAVSVFSLSDQSFL